MIHASPITSFIYQANTQICKAEPNQNPSPQENKNGKANLLNISVAIYHSDGKEFWTCRPSNAIQTRASEREDTSIDSTTGREENVWKILGFYGGNKSAKKKETRWWRPYHGAALSLGSERRGAASWRGRREHLVRRSKVTWYASNTSTQALSPQRAPRYLTLPLAVSVLFSMKGAGERLNLEFSFTGRHMSFSRVYFANAISLVDNYAKLEFVDLN